MLMQMCGDLTSAEGPFHWRPASPAAETWTAAREHGLHAGPASYAVAAAVPHL